MSFFKLLGLVIHWICFLFGSLIAFSTVFSSLVFSDDFFISTLMFGVGFGTIISLFGTLMRFFLAGETIYLPWSKVKKIENNSNEKSITEKIGLAIHWFCFLLSSFIGFLYISGLFSQDLDDFYIYSLIFGLCVAIIILLFGTLMRFILVGDTKYLPWSKVTKIENNSKETDASIETKLRGFFTGSTRMRFLLIYLSVLLILLIFVYSYVGLNLLNAFLILSEYN